MRQTLKTTTAMIASLSLIAPLPAAAQEAPADAPLFICADGSAQPCASGVEMIPAGEAACADGSPVPCPAGVGLVPTAEASAETVRAIEAAAGAAAPAETPPPAEEAAPVEEPAPPAEEAAPVEEPAPPAEEAAPVEEPVPPAEEAAPVEEPVPPAEDAAPVEEPAPPAEDAAPAEEPAPAEEAAPEAPVEEPAPAPEATGTIDPDTSVAPPPEAAEPAPEVAPDAEPLPVPETPEAAPETEAAPDTGAATPAEPAPAPEAEATEAAPDADVDALAEELERALEGAEGGAAEALDDAAEAVEDATAPEAAPVEVAPTGELAEILGEEPVVLPLATQDQPEPETGEAPEVAAAAAEEGAAEAEAGIVIEEEVTEADARSSAEDFANRVSEGAAAPQLSAAAAEAATRARAGRDGLSDGEKAVLLGLGALAVGAILSNNRQVELNSGDRVVVTRPDGSYQLLKDDDTLLRQPGSTVRTEAFRDGSTRSTVTRPDGTQIVTVRDAELRVLRRVRIEPDGRRTVLIDDTVPYEPVDVRQLPPPPPAPVLSDYRDEQALRAALEREAAVGRSFSLSQVRNIAEVRALVPPVDLDAITFASGSAAITPDQARALASLGQLMQDYIRANPREVFLIEGHTDAVGSAASNLALSDRRAESVALALTEYFRIPPENMVVQGYGEQFLKVNTQEAERANRRASVRRITDLLRHVAAN